MSVLVQRDRTEVAACSHVKEDLAGADYVRLYHGIPAHQSELCNAVEVRDEVLLNEAVQFFVSDLKLDLGGDKLRQKCSRGVGCRQRTEIIVGLFLRQEALEHFPPDVGRRFHGGTDRRLHFA